MTRTQTRIGVVDSELATRMEAVERARPFEFERLRGLPAAHAPRPGSPGGGGRAGAGVRVGPRDSFSDAAARTEACGVVGCGRVVCGGPETGFAGPRARRDLKSRLQ